MGTMCYYNCADAVKHDKGRFLLSRFRCLQSNIVYKSPLVYGRRKAPRNRVSNGSKYTMGDLYLNASPQTR